MSVAPKDGDPHSSPDSPTAYVAAEIAAAEHPHHGDGLVRWQAEGEHPHHYNEPHHDGLIRWQGKVICWGKKKKIVSRWVGVAAIALAVAAIGPCIYVLRDQYNSQLHIIAWFVAGMFALLTFPVSVFGIILHLNHYNKPELQRYIIRIMWMPPIYGFACWFSLLFKNESVYWTLLREFYEAYCIYCFTFFLMALLEEAHKAEELDAKERAEKIARGEPVPEPQPEPVKYGRLYWCFGEKIQKPQKWMWFGPSTPDEIDDIEHRHMHHIFPLCWLPEWSMEPVKNPDMPTMDSHFAANVRYGVLLYVVTKILMSIVTFITDQLGVYGNGQFTPTVAYPYVALVTNAAQLWAMYCLVVFYHTYHKDIGRYRPFPKFLAIKLVVFFAFWQSVIVAGLVQEKLIEQPLESTYTVGQVADGLQNFIITIEMFFAAWFHLYAFSHQDYKRRQDGNKLSVFQMIRTIFDVQDVAHDLKLHAKAHVRKLEEPGSQKDHEVSTTTDSLSPSSNPNPTTPTAGSHPYQVLDNPDMARNVSTQSEGGNALLQSSPPASPVASPTSSQPSSSATSPTPAQGGASAIPA